MRYQYLNYISHLIFNKMVLCNLKTEKELYTEERYNYSFNYYTNRMLKTESDFDKYKKNNYQPISIHYPFNQELDKKAIELEKEVQNIFLENIVDDNDLRDCKSQLNAMQLECYILMKNLQEDLEKQVCARAPFLNIFLNKFFWTDPRGKELKHHMEYWLYVNIFVHPYVSYSTNNRYDLEWIKVSLPMDLLSSLEECIFRVENDPNLIGLTIHDPAFINFHDLLNELV